MATIGIPEDAITIDAQGRIIIDDPELVEELNRQTLESPGGFGINWKCPNRRCG